MKISEATNQKIEGSAFWCCNNVYNGFPCEEHDENVISCMNRWSRITRVFLAEQ